MKKRTMRTLGEDDAKFLEQLRKDILNGDRCYQREPAFWGILDKHEFGNSDPEGSDCEYVVEDGCVMTPEEARKAYAEDGYENMDECEHADKIVKELHGQGNCKPFASYGHSIRLLSDDTGAFLTLEDCLKHLEENAHHYSEDACAFAMTAWRNPRFERLWHILTETKWQAKETPKKPIYHRFCPVCGRAMPKGVDVNYCPYCGQRLDFEKEEKE